MKRVLIVLGWLLLWQAASFFIGQSVILPGPLEAAAALAAQMAAAEFWRAAAFTMARIAGGFLLAFFAGLFLGWAAYRHAFLRDILAPAVSVMKCVPVACFVVLALVWAGSERLTFLVVFFIAFPILYQQTMEGLRQTDAGLLEMADTFGMSLRNRLVYLYLPALLPALLSGCRLALGLGWKSGVAAELIGTPLHSIGQQLYFAKIYLETDRLFAWTLVIVLCSLLFEKAFLWLLARLAALLERENELRMREHRKTV